MPAVQEEGSQEADAIAILHDSRAPVCGALFAERPARNLIASTAAYAEPQEVHGACAYTATTNTRFRLGNEVTRRVRMIRTPPDNLTTAHQGLDSKLLFSLSLYSIYDYTNKCPSSPPKKITTSMAPGRSTRTAQFSQRWPQTKPKSTDPRRQINGWMRCIPLWWGECAREKERGSVKLKTEIVRTTGGCDVGTNSEFRATRHEE